MPASWSAPERLRPAPGWAARAPPPPQRGVHNAQHEVHAPQRAVFLAGGARAIAVAGEPLDIGAGFFLGGIVEAEPNDFACEDKPGRQADDRPSEGPVLVVERATEEPI